MRLGIRQTQVPKRFQTIGLSLDPIRYHFHNRSKGLDGLELHVARMIGPENYQSIYQAFAHSVPLSDREVPRAWNFGTRSRVAQRLSLWGSKGLESFETHARAAQRPVVAHHFCRKDFLFVAFCDKLYIIVNDKSECCTHC